MSRLKDRDICIDNRPQSNPPHNSNKAPSNFTPLLEPLYKLFQKLLGATLMTWMPPKPTTYSPPKSYNLNLSTLPYRSTRA